MGPSDPIAAVTHPDPYPYYAELVARRPFYRDESLALWVASSAAAVTAVLTSEACRVRPRGEPVPKAILGSPAAEIFRRLIRMNDGSAHCPLKQAVSATLSTVDPGRAADCSRRWARHLGTASHLDDFAMRLPVLVVGSLLGVPDDRLEPAAAWLHDYVRCLAPSSTAEELARGGESARRLLDLADSLLDGATPAAGRGLLTLLADEARRVGQDDRAAVAANGIGFMSQACEATAGLIGNTLVALGRRPELLARIAAEPALLGAVVDETLRHDPPVQNTRRFLAHDAELAGVGLRADDAVLVVLAAAGYDPAVNPLPDRFDVARRERRTFTFSTGVHACPGEALARAIARGGVEHLIASGVDPAPLARAVRYRPSANIRMPIFGQE